MIDADKLKEKIEQVKNNYNPSSDAYLDFCSIEDLLDASPIVNGWTPISEAMPEEYRSTRDIFDIDKGERVKSESDVVIVTALDDDGTRYSGLDYTVNGKFDTSVIAWQPLPEPYDGGENNVQLL